MEPPSPPPVPVLVISFATLSPELQVRERTRVRDPSARASLLTSGHTPQVILVTATIAASLSLVLSAIALYRTLANPPSFTKLVASSARAIADSLDRPENGAAQQPPPPQQQEQQQQQQQQPATVAAPAPTPVSRSLSTVAPPSAAQAGNMVPSRLIHATPHTRPTPLPTPSTSMMPPPPPPQSMPPRPPSLPLAPPLQQEPLLPRARPTAAAATLVSTALARAKAQENATMPSLPCAPIVPTASRSVLSLRSPAGCEERKNAPSAYTQQGNTRLPGPATPQRDRTAVAASSSQIVSRLAQSVRAR